ncbi:unnamed protein product [Lactuca saligna]|uniref:Uncharacterized protein n=1 Tax=Lactuca saligna TaxID=75948 RepID=A0AA35YH79_LACSI|nr:unnamed protein product [Lactuca saligna]CAI9273843.1 unnamed protein product [Lactuca saligna]
MESKSGSHQILKDRDKNRVEDLHGMFTNLQLTRKLIRCSKNGRMNSMSLHMLLLYNRFVILLLKVRTHIIFFIEAMVTKLVLCLTEVQMLKSEVNRVSTQVLLIVVSMVQLSQFSFLPHPIDSDSYDRIVVCVRLLCNRNEDMKKIWLQSCCESFVQMLVEKHMRETEETKAKALVSHGQPDALIDFYHLKSRKEPESCLDAHQALAKMLQLNGIKYVYVDDLMDDIGEIPILFEWNHEFQFCWNEIMNSNYVGIT